MNLVLIGGASADKVKEVIEKQYDDINVQKFPSLAKFIELANMRSTPVERFILLQDALTSDKEIETKLVSFNEYIGNRYPSSRLVTIVRDKSMLEMLSVVFLSPLMVHVCAEKMKPTMLNDIVTLPIEVVRKKYGSSVISNREDDIIGEIVGEVTQEPLTQSQQNEPQDINTQESKKKKGLFANLFGGKGRKKEPKKGIVPETQQSGFQPLDIPKLEKPEESFNDVPEQSTQDEQEFVESNEEIKPPKVVDPKPEDAYDDEDFDMEFSMFGLDGESNVGVGTDIPNDFTTKVDKSDPFEGFEDFSNFEDTSTSDNKQDFTSSDDNENFDEGLTFPDDNTEPNEVADGNEETHNISKESEDSFIWGIEDTPMGVESSDFENKPSEETQDSNYVFEIPKTNPQFSNNDPIWVQPVFNNEEQNKAGLDIHIDSNDVEDLDFNFTTEENVSMETVNKLNELKESIFSKGIDRVETGLNLGVNSRPSIVITDVDTSTPVFADIDTLTKAYDDENVRVVEKVVEKVIEVETVVEKVVNVGNKKRSYKNGIRTIIITGDRKTGVTGTALNMSAHFAKTSRTLYVDFDIERKGSLLYLGIENVIDEEEHVQNGLTHLKNIKTLENVVYPFSKGGFDCLISMYGENVEESRLRDIQLILSTQRDYKTMIIDCPLENLHLLEDIVLYSEVIVCMETDLPCVLNTVLGLSKTSDNDKFLSFLFNNGHYFLGKGGNLQDFKVNMDYVKDMFSLEDESVNWGDIQVVGSIDNFDRVLEAF